MRGRPRDSRLALEEGREMFESREEPAEAGVCGVPRGEITPGVEDRDFVLGRC